jgi:hypothetical protein
VFLSGAEMRVSNLTNHQAEGMAEATLTGRFMGSGRTNVRARFLPRSRGANFDVNGRIENTDMRAMNNLLRSYGKFDVVRGVFRCIRAPGERRTGPGIREALFRDMDVYDSGQDRHKPLLTRFFEGVVGGLSKMLENRPREEVATRADLSGRVDNPNANALAVGLRLIQNAFFRAILPGFDREVQRLKRSEARSS